MTGSTNGLRETAGPRLPDVLLAQSGLCERIFDDGGIPRKRSWRAEVRVSDGEEVSDDPVGEGAAGDPAAAFRRAVDAAIRRLRGAAGPGGGGAVQAAPTPRLPGALRVESGRCERIFASPGGCRLRRWRATVQVVDDRGVVVGGKGEAGDPAVAFRRAVSAAIRLGGIKVGGAS